MPDINLPRNFTENPASAMNAGNVILSYMVHPNDEKKRLELIQLSNLDIKQRIRDIPFSDSFLKQIPILSQNLELVEELREDGIQNILSPYLILPENTEKFLLNINATAAKHAMFEPDVQKSWNTVYGILLTMMRMERWLPNIKGGASVSKAADFLEKTNSKNIMGNRADIMKAWKEYKGIAHYLFPFFLMCNKPETHHYCHIFTTGGITGFLVMAGNIQKWMLSQKVQHSKSDRLFAKKDLWLIPSLYKIQEIQYNVASFTDAELTVIKGYKRF